MKQLKKPTRESGKSNQQVVIELVCDSSPGETFDYETLRAALSEGSPTMYERHDIQQIVRQAQPRLLREHQRCLRPIKGVGYQLAFASDHVELAGEFNRGALRKQKRAIDRLNYVRLDEMSPQQREIHLAQQQINASQYALNKRLLRQDDAIKNLVASLTSRVEQVEARR